MFLGHFGAGFSAAAATRRVSPGTLLLAAQFIDLLWPFFLIFGIERVAIEPGNSVVTPLHFEHYPWSHSGLMVLVWAVAVGGLYFAFRKDLRTSIVLGVMVFSHWLLDIVVHVPDLPLFPWGGPMIGLSLWNSLPITMILELGVLATGIYIYSRRSVAKGRMGSISLWSFAIFLVGVYLGNVFGPVPDDVVAIGWVGLSQWLLIAWGYWIGKTRVWEA